MLPLAVAPGWTRDQRLQDFRKAFRYADFRVFVAGQRFANGLVREG
jgi:hypothetical protein